MKKRRWKANKPRDKVLTACRHFIHQLGLLQTASDLDDKLAQAAQEQGLVLVAEQQTQGTHFYLARVKND